MIYSNSSYSSFGSESDNVHNKLQKQRGRDNVFPGTVRLKHMWDAIIKITKLFTTWKTSQPLYPEQQEDHKSSVSVVTAPTHLDSGTTVQPLGQQPSCLDGHGGELQLPLQNVTDGIDVRHVGLLFLCDRYFSSPANSFS